MGTGAAFILVLTILTITLLICAGIVILYSYCAYYSIQVIQFITTNERNNRVIGKVLKTCFNLRHLIFALSLFFLIPLCLFLLYMGILIFGS